MACVATFRPLAKGGARRGVSVLEAVVAMGLLVVLAGISITVLLGARKSRALAQCAANLHAMSHAFLLYTQDYNDFYPVPTPAAQWEDQLRAYVPRSTFDCPADHELYDALSSSYDWRDTGNPATTLAGVPASKVIHPDVALAFDALPDWHAPGKIQVLRADASIGLTDMNAFFGDLQRSPTAP